MPPKGEGKDEAGPSAYFKIGSDGSAKYYAGDFKPYELPAELKGDVEFAKKLAAERVRTSIGAALKKREDEFAARANPEAYWRSKLDREMNAAKKSVAQVESFIDNAIKEGMPADKAARMAEQMASALLSFEDIKEEPSLTAINESAVLDGAPPNIRSAGRAAASRPKPRKAAPKRRAPAKRKSGKRK